jgi:putative ABC transport system permease protein
MRTMNLASTALRSIFKNAMRSLLTMLGIIIGVSAVIVMVAVGDGATSQIEQQIADLGVNMLVVSPGSSQQGGVSRGAGSLNQLKVDDADAIAEQSLLVTAVSPVIIAPSQIVGGEGNWRVPVMGVSTDYPVIRGWEVTAGRLFDGGDERSKRKVAVIGQTIVDALFPNMDPVGEDLRIHNVPFEIIGVLAEKGETANGSDQDDVVLAPYTTVQTRLAGRQFIAMILAGTSSPDDVAAAQEEITQILRDAHGLASWEEDDFTVRNQTEIAETAAQTTEVMTTLLAAIAGISLLVGGIGIMNIMLVSVTERTREIGVRMAMGARESDVMAQFLVESVVMSLAGGMIGIAVGFAGSSMLGSVTGWATLISPQTVAIALAFAAAVGIGFGLYPARKAASLDPIEALRYE